MLADDGVGVGEEAMTGPDARVEDDVREQDGVVAQGDARLQ